MKQHLSLPNTMSTPKNVVGTECTDHQKMLSLLRSDHKDPYLKRHIKFFTQAFRRLQTHEVGDEVSKQHLKQITTLMAKQILSELEVSSSMKTLN